LRRSREIVPGTKKQLPQQQLPRQSGLGRRLAKTASPTPGMFHSTGIPAALLLKAADLIDRGNGQVAQPHRWSDGSQS
jgi:hypothetical protein